MNRLAVLSLHTSPLVQPGSGDSGGMNVDALNGSYQRHAHSQKKETRVAISRGFSNKIQVFCSI